MEDQLVIIVGHKYELRDGSTATVLAINEGNMYNVIADVKGKLTVYTPSGRYYNTGYTSIYDMVKDLTEEGEADISTYKAALEEANRRYTPGDVLESTSDDGSFYILKSFEFDGYQKQYFSDHQTLMVTCSQNGVRSILRKGKWANKIDSPEYSMGQLFNLVGHRFKIKM
jgi:hypothetical protein